MVDDNLSSENLHIFNESINNTKNELDNLSIQVNSLINNYKEKENIKNILPLELRESIDDSFSRRMVFKKKSIQLEELLLQIQLKMDKLQLPRIIVDGNNIPDPKARKERKSIVQTAENLIQKLQEIKQSDELSKL